MKDIIGISAYYHDSSVSLIRNGEVKGFIKEEAITRVKGISTFPKESLKYLIETFDVLENNIQAVCFYEKPLRGWLSLLSHSIERPYERWPQTATLLRKFWDGPIFFSEELKKVIQIPRERILYCQHHLSHALSGLLHTDQTKDWVVIVLDGVGDGETGSIFSAKGDKIDRVWGETFPNSLGLFYSAITDYLGYSVNDGEYKVMALAAYGQPVYLDRMQKIISFENERLYLDLSYFEFHKNPERSYSDKFIEGFGLPASDFSDPLIDSSPEFKRLCNIASSAQVLTEHILEKIVNFATTRTGCRNVVLSGGIAHNCVAIANLLKKENIDQLIVPPSPGDSGAALGAALYAYMIEGNRHLPQPVLYPGPSPSPPNVIESLFKLQANKEKRFEKSADLLKRGEILGTFIGNSEMGPRALGHRSLLCNAADRKTVKKLNSVIKKREAFRPLAPVLKSDIADEYFYLSEKNRQNYLWMGCIAKARPITHAGFDGILHIDGSARLQIVTEDEPQFWNFLMACEKVGMPILVNTSFNIAGDPIVFDYIDCFVNMKRMGIRWLLTDTGLYECLNV